MREDFARRADAAYEMYVKPNLAQADHGRFVALDVDSGIYEIDDDDLAAIHRLRQRKPDAAGWLVRVGSRYVDRLGRRGGAAAPN